VFKRLSAAVKEALDERVEPVKRLIRQLLRTQNSDERKEILTEALRPKTPTLRADGSKTDVKPEVSPPELSTELKTLIRNFGNLEELNEKLRWVLGRVVERDNTDVHGV